MENVVLSSRAAVMQSGELQTGLIDEFIRFIDRGEKTTRTYITNLRQFVAWLRYEHISAPTRQDIITYRDYLAAEHEAIQISDTAAGWAYRLDSNGNRYTIQCKPNTVAQYLRSVCQFFRWTAANNLYPNIADNIHAPKIRHDAHKKDALTPADVLAIENSIMDTAESRKTAAGEARKDTAGRIERATEQGKRLYAMYLLAVNCGLRTVELSRANVKDIETKNGTAHLYVWGKGHSEADTRKTLAPEVKEAIDDYLKSRTDHFTGNSPLFVATGNRSGGKRIAVTTISTMLKRAMQAAGYDSERLTAHSLRHTAGTNVQEITGNLYLTQQYMRHSNPATTEIYLHNRTDKQEADIARRLYGFYHGNAGQDHRERLDGILQSMTAAQIEQITSIAAAMAH